MLRIFGARKKEDTFHLYDEETGLPSSDFSEQIGEELFGIDRESFSRTVFWSQQDHETEATTMIQAKIGDVASEQDDLTSYDRAVRQLKKEIDRLSPDRASGQIRKKQDRAAVLEAEAARLPGLKRELQHGGSKKSLGSLKIFLWYFHSAIPAPLKRQKIPEDILIPGGRKPGQGSKLPQLSPGRTEEEAPAFPDLKAVLRKRGLQGDPVPENTLNPHGLRARLPKDCAQILRSPAAVFR